jgi:hypothetical protein
MANCFAHGEFKIGSCHMHHANYSNPSMVEPHSLRIISICSTAKGSPAQHSAKQHQMSTGNSGKPLSPWHTLLSLIPHATSKSTNNEPKHAWWTASLGIMVTLPHFALGEQIHGLPCQHYMHANKTSTQVMDKFDQHMLRKGHSQVADINMT